MKETLHRYLRAQREAVLWKVEGLSERQLRTPMTPSGTNLLGLVKHLSYGEAGYLGLVFGRPAPLATWDWTDAEEDPHADLFATAAESREDVVEGYRQACAHADETITALSLEDTGEVPWWAPERRTVTLHQVLVHVLAETARHAGHLDILREQVDGAAGLRAGNTNLPDDDYDWASYVAKLRGIAESF